MLDLQPGTAFGRIHHADVDMALDEPQHQLRLQPDLRPHRDLWCVAQQTRQKGQQELLPETEPRTDGHCTVKASGHADVVACLLDGTHQGRGMFLEVAARRGEGGSSLVADEQLAAEDGFESLDARTDRGLGDVQPLCGADEIAGRHHCQESTRKLGIHADFYIDSIDIIERFSSFSKCVPVA